MLFKRNGILNQLISNKKFHLSIFFSLKHIQVLMCQNFEFDTFFLMCGLYSAYLYFIPFSTFMEWKAVINFQLYVGFEMNFHFIRYLSNKLCVFVSPNLWRGDIKHTISLYILVEVSFISHPFSL